jgi:hypothetical protein
MNRSRTGGFQDQARLGLFVLPFGPLAPVVSVMGDHGRPLFFHGLFPILESSQFR